MHISRVLFLFSTKYLFFGIQWAAIFELNIQNSQFLTFWTKLSETTFWIVTQKCTNWLFLIVHAYIQSPFLFCTKYLFFWIQWAAIFAINIQNSQFFHILTEIKWNYLLNIDAEVYILTFSESTCRYPESFFILHKIFIFWDSVSRDIWAKYSK